MPHCCHVWSHLCARSDLRFSLKAEWKVFFLPWEQSGFVSVWLQVSTAPFLISFQDGCYRNCPAKTYSVEEEMSCVPCDDNCVSCDEHECYWCETDLFLSGETTKLCVANFCFVGNFIYLFVFLLNYLVSKVFIVLSVGWWWISQSGFHHKKCI